MTDRGQQEVFPLPIAGAVVGSIAIWMMFKVTSDVSRQELVTAEQQVVTNCAGAGAGCGMVDLVIIAGVVLVLAVAVSFVISLPKEWPSDE